MLWGPQPRWFAITQKKYKRADRQAAEVSGLGQAQYYDIIYRGCPCAPFHVLFGFKVLGPVNNISICLFVVATYPSNPSHPGALTR